MGNNNITNIRNNRKCNHANSKGEQKDLGISNSTSPKKQHNYNNIIYNDHTTHFIFISLILEPIYLHLFAYLLKYIDIII